MTRMQTEDGRIFVEVEEEIIRHQPPAPPGARRRSGTIAEGIRRGVEETFHRLNGPPEKTFMGIKGGEAAKFVIAIVAAVSGAYLGMKTAIAQNESEIQDNQDLIFEFRKDYKEKSTNYELQITALKEASIGMSKDIKTLTKTVEELRQDVKQKRRRR